MKLLTFCGYCPLCGKELTLISVHDYFSNNDVEVLGYRGRCVPCNAKSKKTYSSVLKLTEDHMRDPYGRAIPIRRGLK